MAERETETAILEVAQELAQTVGFHAFSYRDLAERIGIKSATIHYYFPSKANLGKALMCRFGREVEELLREIDSRVKDPRRKLERYVRFFHDTFDSNRRMCLAGMLAAETATLPEIVQDEVRRFIAANEDWLTKVLEEGRLKNVLQFSGSARDTSRWLFASLEGAMLTARAFGDADRFGSATRKLLDFLSTGG